MYTHMPTLSAEMHDHSYTHMKVYSLLFLSALVFRMTLGLLKRYVNVCVKVILRNDC